MRNRVISFFGKIAAIAAALSGVAVAPVHAQSIENVATIEWDSGISHLAQQSNRVTLQLETAPSLPTSLAVYRLDAAAGASTLPVPTTMCQSASGPQAVTLSGVFAGTSLSPASVRPSDRIRAGEPLIVSLTSAADNRSVTDIETKTIVLTTPSGDRETITLTETGRNTAVFVGIINTIALPPAPIQADCRLSVLPGETLLLSSNETTGGVIATRPVEVLIDPFGIVFDSGDGAPVPGSRVTLVDAATGQPAQVFGDDGVSTYPNSMIVGSTVTDSSGKSYSFPAGDYRFPFVRAGSYRLVVEPPAPYTAPSAASPADLASLRRPDGLPYTVTTGSYSDAFTLANPEPVRIDIPVDRPGVPLVLRKTASQPTAAPGDALQYRIEVQNGDVARSTGAITVTDILPIEIRLRKDTVRFNGVATAYAITPDGRTLTVTLPPLAAGATGILTYLTEIRPDARPGRVMNRASARDNRGTTSPVTDATVRIMRDAITERMTIIGRITDGGCLVDDRKAQGVFGVRVMLEDGSYTITDEDGRYHFDGVLPGLHVVQIDPATLGAGRIAADCTRNARAGGSAISRFVEGQGGALLRADFRTTAGENKTRIETTSSARAAPLSNPDAAGANRDWFTGEAPGIAWLFPEPDHNPRAKAVRVAIKHLPGQSVRLTADGKPVPGANFDGARTNGAGNVAVSTWRGVEIGGRDTVLKAEIVDADGTVIETLTRTVHFAAAPMHAELVREKSVLIADGVTRPVIAVRLTDRDGHPVHQGVTGDFDVPAPYAPAIEVDAQNARHLSGLERARPVWIIEGDDGISYIELEPTTASGSVALSLPLREGEVTHNERIDLWLDPGKRAWTVVGFAAGTAGFNTLETHKERLASGGESWLTDGRLALYAKGRVKGKWLMTMSYDSDKDRDDSRFAGTIDPQAYYTVYADRNERRYDAASVRKLYLKLERPQFYALFGDYETGLSDTQLTRYVRAFNGVKAEYRSEQVGVTAFAADTPYRHRREEIQGNGLTGPYPLAARDILANSERVTIETRDRLRSDRIVETKTLVRHIDYDIDYIAGTLRFREPVLSRSSGLDPQFIVVDYEVDGVAQRATNAGGRISWNNDKRTLFVGATGVHDEDEDLRTDMGGVDLKFRPNANTEVRAEFAVSRQDAKAGSTTTPAADSHAWLVEAEHHGPKFDILAYAREQQGDYGVGQTNGAENGTRKFGIDGRARLTKALSITGSGWFEDYLASDARRTAARALVEYRTNGLDTRAGVTFAHDRLSDGRTAESAIGQFGVTKRLLNNKLELDAQTETPLSNSADSVDFPARHKLSARYAMTSDIALVGSYEIADGDAVDARTARVGFDLKPWAGGRFVSSINRQDIAEYGPRTYAAYGLAQSVPVSKRVTLDLTLDGNKTLGGIEPARVLNPLHPVASGGYLGQDGGISEDFTAATVGMTYRSDRWSWTARAEARSGSSSDRYGFTAATMRQVGEGRALGGQLSFFRANGDTGISTETASATMSWAHRPAESRFAFLNKFELRSDKAINAQFGQPGPIGGAPLLIDGNAKSQRAINSFTMNWSPTAKNGDEYLTRTEFSLFWGSRYVSDRFGQDDLKGWSNVVGSDIRFDLGKMVDIGASGTVRINPGARAYSWSGGPTIGISPFKNSYFSIGYNFAGFKDRDFEASRYSRSGPFITLRMKFDQTSFQSLGLGR